MFVVAVSGKNIPVRSLSYTHVKRTLASLTAIATVTIYLYITNGDGQYFVSMELAYSSSGNASSTSPVTKFTLSTAPNASEVGRTTASQVGSRRLDQLASFYPMTNVCNSLITPHNGSELVVDFAVKHSNVSSVTNEQYVQSNCSATFKAAYVHDVTMLDPEELQMSIAFAIHMYKDVWQFERLLRAVYRPHHWYCVHVDSKSSVSTYAAVKQIASCFDNVILASNRVSIEWGTMSVVDAELQCMRDLLTSDKKWRYFINLTGQEYPLKTMWQLVRILKALNGSNSMECTVKYNQAERRQQLLPFAQKYNITPVKGAIHLVVVRGFVQYALNNSIAIGMAQHLRSAPYPDESFFATLNHNPVLRVPGGYLGEPENGPQYPYFNRLKH